ncbi:General transcription factor IIIC, polypeptide 3 [Chamberlinius hualienensis]
MSKDVREESNLFKSLTDRNLSDEQLDEFRKMKKLTRELVDQDSESSDTLSDNDDDDFIFSDRIIPVNPGPSTSTVVVANDFAITNDEKNRLVKRYLDGEISFVEFTQLLQDPKWSTDEKLAEKDEQSSGDVEDEVDLSYEDNENDEDYIPPRSLKKRKVYEKQEMAVASSSMEKTPTKKVTKANKPSPVENIFEPEEKKKQKRARSRLPADLEGLLGQARLSLVRNDQESAIKMCLEVIRLGGHSPEVYETLEMIYEDSGDLYKILSTRIMVATLKVNDAQAWANVAEVYAELDQLNDASKCYKKAVHYDPTNLQYKWTLFHLLEKLNRKEKSLELLQQIVKNYSSDDGENILFVTKEIAERQFKDGHTELAKTTMEEAFFKHSDHIISEDVNFLLDLKIKLREYAQSVKILCKFCGVKFEPPLVSESISEAEFNTLESTLQDRRSCITPDILPIDLCAKLLICCLHLKAHHLTSDLKSTLFQSNPEETGDLYLDVAEAYMETKNANEALPILATLVSTEKYNRPMVWQKYGECQMAARNMEEAEQIYRHLLELVPNHAAARIVLSGILQQLGRSEESLEVLTTVGSEDSVEFDPVLQIQKATMLYSREKWEEFVAAAKILHSAHTLWKEDYSDAGTFSTCNVSKVRELYKQWKDEMPGILHLNLKFFIDASNCFYDKRPSLNRRRVG